MSVRNLYCLALTAVLMTASAAEAQSEARFKLVQTGVNQLNEDLKYLVELSPTPAMKKQWDNTLEPLIDSFAVGIDTTKPIRVDFVFGKTGMTTELHFPVKKLEGNNSFLENVNGFGYKDKKLAANFYSLTELGRKGAPPKQPVFLRHLHGYGSIAPTQGAVPANLPDPITAVQALLDKGFDVAGELKNDADGIPLRRDNFSELRKQLEAAMVFKRNEDKNEFELRKLSLAQNLNEAERFLVETEELVFGWSTIPATQAAPGKGHAEFSLVALAGTGLFASSQLLAAKPSYFANVKLHGSPAVSGKINFAIDQVRVAHLTDFYKLVRPLLETQIDQRASLKDAEQKTAAKKAANTLLDMFAAGLPLGVVDTFLDLHLAGDGKQTLLCGVRAADGKAADEIVKLLPQMNFAGEVKLDTQQIGDASLHAITVPERRLAAFQKLFPGETVLYVATSKDAVWGAAGVNAVAELETAIKATADPAPAMIDPRVLYFTMHAGRFVDLLDIVRPEPQKSEGKPTKEEEQLEKEREKIRKLAVDATQGCDPLLSGEVKRNGNKVEGTMDVSECALKFVGSVIADFAKDLQ